MTARMRAGWKPGVGPVLKIMKDAEDDPFTTPNSEHDKFIFNSETTRIGYLLGIEVFSYGGPSVYPSAGGTSVSPNVYHPRPHYRVEAYVQSSIHYERHFFNFKAAYDLPWMPFLEIRMVDASNWTFNCHRFSGILSRELWWNFVRYASWWVNETNATEVYSPVDDVGYSWSSNFPAAHAFRRVVSVFEFPCDASDYEVPEETPVAGQKVLRIDPDAARMARAGYDVDTATGRELIFDGDRVPAKILAAGEIVLSSGASADIMIDEAFQPLGTLTYVDTIVQYTSVAEYYHPSFHRIPANSSLKNEGPTYDYTVLPDRVRFTSTTAQEIKVRYMVVADDTNRNDGAPKAKVMDVAEDGHVRICRPGAGEPPALRDIILDSRLPYLPIIAEGYIAPGSFTIPTDDPQLGSHYAPDILFENTGFLPFLKYSVCRFISGSISDIFPPTVARHRHDPGSGNLIGLAAYHYRNSHVARLFDDRVRFYSSPNMPLSANWTAGSGGTPPNPPRFTRNDSPDVAFGIRYYVFAIPTS